MSHSSAQIRDPESSDGADPELGDALEESTRDVGDSPLAEILTDLEENPLDLNLASKEELQQVPEITPVIARNITLRRLRARFKNVDELLEIDGFSAQLLSRVRRFVTVQTTGERAEYVVVRSRSSRRVPSGVESQSAESAEFPWKTYYRVLGGLGKTQIISSRDATFGVLIEKDEGERLVNCFISGFWVLSLLEGDAKVLVGDYTVEAAQGLVFSRARNGSKGSDVTGTAGKNRVGLRPYSSTNETAFLRGVGVNIRSSVFNGSVFYSNKPSHGTLDSNGILTGLYSTGLFRTPAELARRNAAREKLFGLQMTSELQNGLNVGVTGFISSFNHPLNLSGTSGFVVKNLSVIGADLAFTGGQMDLHVEAARSSHGGIGVIGGANLHPVSSVDVAFHLRQYTNGFVQLHASGFAESAGEIMNETGMYVGMKMEISTWLTLRAYYDQFHIPGRGIAIHPSISGNDFLGILVLDPIDKNTLTLQYHRKEKSIVGISSDILGRDVKLLEPGIQHSFRVNLATAVTGRLRLVSRAEVARIDRPYNGFSETGTLIFQDVSVELFKLARLDLRVVFFDTESYDSRVYEFESDLSGTFSNPPLYGRGIRCYCVLRMGISRNLRLSGKYSKVIKESAESDRSTLHDPIPEGAGMLSLQVDFSL
ncbi:MAG: helix-hairpin-helix domain-containing protein [Bacteroidota bacterium]